MQEGVNDPIRISLGASRRAVLTGIAWTAPVIAAAATVPLSAASVRRSVTISQSQSGGTAVTAVAHLAGFPASTLLPVFCFLKQGGTGVQSPWQGAKYLTTDPHGALDVTIGTFPAESLPLSVRVTAIAKGTQVDSPWVLLAIPAIAISFDVSGLAVGTSAHFSGFPPNTTVPVDFRSTLDQNGQPSSATAGTRDVVIDAAGAATEPFDTFPSSGATYSLTLTAGAATASAHWPT